MDAVTILTSIIEIIVGGLVGIGEGIGGALSSMAQAIFLQTNGDTTTLSVFAIVVFIFGALSLGFGLTRWVLNLITSWGNRNR